MYSYLSTLRLHDGDGGSTMTVGPKRRVVFKNRILYHGNELRKEEIKRVLRPLKQYWGCDDPRNCKAESAIPINR